MNAPIPGRVEVFVWCGKCKAQQGARPGRLGVLLRHDHGGRTWVVEYGERVRYHVPPEVRGRGDHDFTIIEHPAMDVEVPERLPAYCPQHGFGWIASTDIRTARGNVTLTARA